MLPGVVHVPSSVRPKTNIAFCWMNQRRKCVFSFRGPSVRKICNTETQRKCLHKKELNSHRNALVSKMPACRFIKKWKFPVHCSCYSKSRATQSRVCKQNNCPNIGNKSTSSRIPTEKGNVWSRIAPNVSLWLVWTKTTVLYARALDEFIFSAPCEEVISTNSSGQKLSS